MRKLILFLLLALPFAIFAQSNDDNDDRRDDGLVRELKLSTDQEKRWLTVKREYKVKAAEVRADASLTKTEQRRKLKVLHDERRAAQSAILTPAQNKRYDELKQQQKAAKKARKSDTAAQKRVKAAKKAAKAEKKAAETPRQ